eukprot:1319-Chlamydomonas_euryale.AAC.2
MSANATGFCAACATAKPVRTASRPAKVVAPAAAAVSALQDAMAAASSAGRARVRSANAPIGSIAKAYR